MVVVVAVGGGGWGGGVEVFIAESRMPLHPRSSWNVSCVSFFAPSCCRVVSDPVVGVGLLTAIRFVVGGRHPQSAYQNARLRTHKDEYLSVTLKCAQEFVLVTFCSYSAFTNSTHRYKHVLIVINKFNADLTLEQSNLCIVSYIAHTHARTHTHTCTCTHTHSLMYSM